MLFQGKDGELRIYEHGNSGTTYYMEVLFTDMNLNGPTSRPRSEETLQMDRGNFDSNAHYTEGNDEPRYQPISLTFSCKMNDTVDTRALLDWLNGASDIPNAVGGTSTIYSFKGKTTIDGNTLPDFKDSKKYAYRVECLWDGTNDLGYRWEEVYFKAGEQSITEAPDGLTLNANAEVYGDVTRITALTSGGSILAFS